MSEYETLSFQRAGSTTRITLNRPDVDSTKAVILTGAGRFSARAADGHEGVDAFIEKRRADFA